MARFCRPYGAWRFVFAFPGLRPSDENAWDVDYLGQQGFWICLFVALVNLVFIAITASFILNSTARLVTLIVGVLVSRYSYFTCSISLPQAARRHSVADHRRRAAFERANNNPRCKVEACC